MSTRFLHCQVTLFSFLTDKYLWIDTLRLLMSCFSSIFCPLILASIGGILHATVITVVFAYLWSFKSPSFHLRLLIGEAASSPYVYYISYINVMYIYSMGYNLVPSLFILWLKFFWLLGTPSWLPSPFDTSHLLLNSWLFSVIVRYSTYIASAPDLELTTYSRSPGFFCWRIVFRNQDQGSWCAYCYGHCF